MTCIVGLTINGEVWMGSEALSRCGDVDRVCKNPKVIRCGEMLIGSAGDAAFDGLLQYVLEVPPCPADEDVRRYLFRDFRPALLNLLREAGRIKREEGAEEMDGSFLIAMRGRLFNMGGSFDAEEVEDGFDAIGAGAAFAMGALFGLGRVPGLCISPDERILIALQAACRYSHGCCPPFHIEKL